MSKRWPDEAPKAPLLFLLPAGLLELGINRLAVPLLRPTRGVPPAWHTALDYGGLFLFYFASLLGVIVAGLRAWRALEASPEERRVQLLTAAPMLALAALSAWAILVAPSREVTFALECCLAALVLVAVGRSAGGFFGRPRDPGVAIGVLFLALPLLIHFLAVLGARFFWAEDTYDGIGPAVVQVGTLALAVAGLVSPYCLAPRPFVRSVTRVTPMLVAIGVALVAAWLLRHNYLGMAQAIKRAIGVELQTTSADPQLTIYLLAVATLSWTLSSCASAQTLPRRMVAVGLLLLVLGGHAFEWPLHYLLLAIGLTTVADATVPVRPAEQALAAMAPGSGPAIDDATWGRYLGAVSAALRRRCSSLHSLTTRGAEATTSSVLVGEADGRALRVRIDRDHGAVLGLDVAIGRDLELLPRGKTAATLTVACDEGFLPEDAPAAEPAIHSGDAAFDRRFRCRGARDQLERLFDAALRGRAVALLDGWLAVVHGESLRYRSYPSAAAGTVEPLVPLADLAQAQVPAGAGERVMVVMELLLELAARAQVVTSAAGITEAGESATVAAETASASASLEEAAGSAPAAESGKGAGSPAESLADAPAAARLLPGDDQS